MSMETRLHKLETLTGGLTAGDEARLAGDAMRADIHRMLSSPDELAAAMEWDNRYLGQDSPDRLVLEGLNEEAVVDALEQALEPSVA